MANSKLDIANGALQLLGEKTVATEAELPSTPTGAAIFRNYDEVVEERMRAYAWGWLIQTERLVQRVSTSPYDAAWAIYTTPNNILRIVEILLTNGARQAAEYRVDQDGIHAPGGGYLTAVFMRARPEAEWTAEFSRYIQAALALTAAGTVKAEYVSAMADLVMRRYEIARTTDIKASRGNQLQAFDPDGIVRAVGGGGSHRYGINGFGNDVYGGRLYAPQ